MRIPLLFIATLALVLGNAAAHDCVTWSTDDDVELDVDTVVGPRYYVDNDPANVPCCPFGSLWVYEESNGIPGLQRGDEERDHTCHRMIQPDTVVF